MNVVKYYSQKDGSLVKVAVTQNKRAFRWFYNSLKKPTAISVAQANRLMLSRGYHRTKASAFAAGAKSKGIFSRLH